MLLKEWSPIWPRSPLNVVRAIRPLIHQWSIWEEFTPVLRFSDYSGEISIQDLNRTTDFSPEWKNTASSFIWINFDSIAEESVKSKCLKLVGRNEQNNTITKKLRYSSRKDSIQENWKQDTLLEPNSHKECTSDKVLNLVIHGLSGTHLLLTKTASHDFFHYWLICASSFKLPDCLLQGSKP